MIIVFYISGHGFGHATRELEIIRQIRHQAPDARVVIRSAVPGWFLERSARTAVDVQSCEADTGMIQIDSLRFDEAQTIQRAQEFYGTFSERVRAEADVLRQLHASVVVGDVPPLAFAAAARASVPSIAVANFTWDWIYAAYPAFHQQAPDVSRVIGDAYAHTGLALRLPFAGGFATMPRVRNVGLVARRSRRTRAANRRLLGLDDTRPVVLGSFGGHGAALPYAEVGASSDVTLIVTDYEARSIDRRRTYDGRLRCFEADDLERQDIRYEDLVAAADVVVSKPGYGIVSECIANDAALLYTSRGVFAENDVLVSGMARVIRTHYIPPEDLRAGRWEGFIRELLAKPAAPERLAADGATTVAEIIIGVARDQRS